MFAGIVRFQQFGAHGQHRAWGTRHAVRGQMMPGAPNGPPLRRLAAFATVLTGGRAARAAEHGQSGDGWWAKPRWAPPPPISLTPTEIEAERIANAPLPTEARPKKVILFSRAASPPASCRMNRLTSTSCSATRRKTHVRSQPCRYTSAGRSNVRGPDADNAAVADGPRHDRFQRRSRLHKHFYRRLKRRWAGVRAGTRLKTL
jgi:hypothetical protein